LFTKPVPILVQEIWNALHTPSDDDHIISTRKWTRPPTTGYLVDTEMLMTDGFLTIEEIKTWVETHRIAIDFVPNAFIGAHRDYRIGDSVFAVHHFASHPDAVEFARKHAEYLIYTLGEDLG